MPQQLHDLARNSAQEFGSNLTSECNLKITVSLTRDSFIRAAPPKDFRLKIEQTFPPLEFEPGLSSTTYVSSAQSFSTAYRIREKISWANSISLAAAISKEQTLP